MTTILNDRYEDNRAISLLARDQYEREVRWIQAEKLLTKEKEQFLFQRLERARAERHNPWRARLAQDARDQLVEAYQPLVLALAKKRVAYAKYLELLDLVNEGNLGLLQAIDAHACHHPHDFSSFASVYIYHCLLHATSAAAGPVPISSNVWKLIRSMERVVQAFWDEGGYEPSYTQIAEKMNISVARVCELYAYRDRSHLESLDGLLDQGADAYEHLDFVSLYQDSVRAESARQSSLVEKLQGALDSLSPRQKEAISLRYGLDGDHCRTGSELVEHFGTSIGSVHIYAAKNRLRQELASVVAPSDLTSIGGRQRRDPQVRDPHYPDYYSSGEVATVLGMSVGAVGARARRGKLPLITGEFRYKALPVKILFPRQEIDALAAASQSDDDQAEMTA